LLVTSPPATDGKNRSPERRASRASRSLSRRPRPCRDAARGTAAVRFANSPDQCQALEGHGLDFKRGVTVNVGAVQGRHRPNVHARGVCEVDVRVPSTGQRRSRFPKSLNLKSRTKAVSVKVVGGLNRPPYEKGNAGPSCTNRTGARRQTASIGGYIHRWRFRRPFHRTLSAPLDGLALMAKARIPIIAALHFAIELGAAIHGCIRRCDACANPRWNETRRCPV